MNGISEIFDSIAPFLWPIVVVTFIIVFRKNIRAFVEAIVKAIESRGFTLKIGGQELTVEEANQQQSAAISDIQKQIIELQTKISIDPGKSVDSVEYDELSSYSLKILWVDDNPKNNGLIIQQLTDAGIVVELALSTLDGITLYDQRIYDAVISDMGRLESDTIIETAGIDLLKEIRKRDVNIPFYILTTSKNVNKYRVEVANLSANLITSSPTVLMGSLLKLRQSAW